MVPCHHVLAPNCTIVSVSFDCDSPLFLFRSAFLHFHYVNGFEMVHKLLSSNMHAVWTISKLRNYCRNNVVDGCHRFILFSFECQRFEYNKWIKRSTRKTMMIMIYVNSRSMFVVATMKLHLQSHFTRSPSMLFPSPHSSSLSRCSISTTHHIQIIVIVLLLLLYNTMLCGLVSSYAMLWTMANGKVYSIHWNIQK